MRKILYSELVKNRLSIKNNEVIKLENGEFYNKQIAEQIVYIPVQVRTRT